MPIKNIIYRVDGGSKYGFGHIKRAITLNKIFYKKKINFYVKKEVEGFNYVKKFIKNVSLINNKIEKQILIKASNTLIIFDTLLLNKSILEKINLKKNKLIVFEDLKMISKNYANLIINAIVDGPIHREIKIKNGKKLSGSIFKIYHKPEKIIKKEKIITICFGGGNFPKLNYKKCINNLLKIEKLKNYRIICIIGPGSKIIKKDLKSHRRLKILNNVNDLDRFLAKSKIFIGGGGGTIYEALRYKCFTFCYGFNNHQKKNIKNFSKLKLCHEVKDFEYKTLKKIDKTMVNRKLNVIRNRNLNKYIKNNGLKKLDKILKKLIK